MGRLCDLISTAAIVARSVQMRVRRHLCFRDMGFGELRPLFSAEKDILLRGGASGGAGC